MKPNIQCFGKNLVIGYLATALLGCSPQAVQPPGGCDMPDGGGIPHSAGPRSLLYDDMPRNGLAIGTLIAPGMPELLTAITSDALTSDTFARHAADVQTMIDGNPDVESLFDYIVSCALDPGVSVSPNLTKADGSSVEWRGEVGLCGARSPAGRWAFEAPSKDCLELVSSCVLARTNAHHRKVLISARATSIAVSLQDHVPVEQMYRECGGTPIASLRHACDDGAPSDPAQRNCGWTGQFVGTCKAGEPVMLEASPGAVVRVCRGIYGCDARDHDSPPAELDACTAPPVTDADTPWTPWYSGVIDSINPGSTGHFQFRCPSTGIEGETTSYYSIMLAPSQPGMALAAGAHVSQVGGTGAYPAPEGDVFTFREGAFFGNLFSKPNPGPSRDKDFLVGDQQACFSDVWSDASAYFTDRFCVNRGSACFNNPPSPCLWAAGQPGTPAPGSLCGAQTCDAGGRYLHCRTVPDPGAGYREWPNAVTVFLNHPCDLAKDLDSCRAAYKNLLHAPK